MKTTSKNIRQVRDLINNDPYITVDELEAENGLIHRTIQRIIKVFLVYFQSKNSKKLEKT